MSLLGEDRHHDIAGSLVPLGDKSRELMLWSASASLRAMQDKIVRERRRTRCITPTDAERDILKRPLELFDRVLRFPKGQDQLSLYDQYCLVVAEVGVGHCLALLRNYTSAESYLSPAAMQGAAFLAKCPKDDFCFGNNPHAIPDRPLSWGQDLCLIDFMAMAPLPTTALFTRSQFNESSGPTMAFLIVKQARIMLAAMFLHTKRYPEALRQAEETLALVESFADFNMLQTQAAKNYLMHLTPCILLIKALALKRMDNAEHDVLIATWEQLCDKAEQLARAGHDEDAASLLSKCAKQYLGMSGIKRFILDDNVLHTDNSPVAEYLSRAAEIYGLAAVSCAKYIQSIKRVTPITRAVTQALHSAYMDLMKYHLYRGVCAPSKGLAQRYLECSHAAREEFTRSSHWLITKTL